MKGISSFINQKIILPLLLILTLTSAYLLRDKPSELPPPSSPTSAGINATTNDTRSVSNLNLEELFLQPKQISLFDRNPFTPEGSYQGEPLPEEPFKVVAIMIHPTKEAILRTYKGEIVKVKEKDKLFDGSVVIKIEDRKIKLKRLGKERELSLFPVEVDRWKPKQRF